MVKTDKGELVLQNDYANFDQEYNWLKGLKIGNGGKASTKMRYIKLRYIAPYNNCLPTAYKRGRHALYPFLSCFFGIIRDVCCSSKEKVLYGQHVLPFVLRLFIVFFTGPLKK